MLIALAALLFGDNLLHRGQVNPKKHASYMATSDRVCAKRDAELKALNLHNPKPGRTSAEYAETIRRWRVIIEENLRVWLEVPIPDGDEAMVAEIRTLTRQGLFFAREGEGLLRQGMVASANESFEESRIHTGQANQKAAAAGFKSCPFGTQQP
ncbi:hypothetical protein M1P56_21415 [Streptomyces sp. HU2014]|uniref:hypothetical protein n=1 Tax=Streptomyces sp. HU2014 TaxID=2939414 RepID=UPI00200E5E1D|nr:hypothetical protein [Streptomyces sp. HU2014]UQI46726.1 hypothetical protein M1P56_21415 [Streptomyces sp. HU2014]